MNKQYKDLSGATFGYWTVINEASPRYCCGKRIRYWQCICVCGTERAVKEQSLKSGKSKSCGCFHSQIMHESSKWNTTHGLSDSRLYRIYRHMLGRCYNPHDLRYKHYGAKGITVCNEWKSFEPFAEWAKMSGYSDNLSIDRIDVNKGYSPENCRWATLVEQANNKTNTKYLTYNGETKSIAEWAKELGMTYKKLYKRIYVGWDVERALTT